MGRSRALLAVAALGLVVPVLSSCQVPTTLTVTTTADGADAAPGDGTCATATGDCTLRAALQEASALSGPVAVELATAVTYPLTIPGAEEDAGATGDLDVASGDITVHGHGSTIDAGGLDRVVDIHSGTLELDDLTITHGSAQTSGGGVRNAGNLRLLHSTLSANRTTAPANFLGYALDQTAGSMILADDRVVDNAMDVTPNGFPTSVISRDAGTAVIADTTMTGNWNSSPADFEGTNSNIVLFDFATSGPPVSLVNVDIGDNQLTMTVCTASGCHDLSSRTISVGTLDAVAISHSRLVGDSTDLLSIPGHIMVSSSQIGVCEGATTQSAGYNRIGANDPSSPCATTATDVIGSLLPIVDQIPIGTPSLCDSTTPPDRNGITRPQGAACDIGPTEQ